MKTDDTPQTDPHPPQERPLRPSESYLRAVLDHVLDGIISINDACIIETFNPAAETIFGYTAAEVIGRNVNLLMPEPYRSQHDDYVKNYIRTEQAKIIGIGREVLGRRKDGHVFPLDLAVTQMWVGRERKFIGILRDITDRKMAEDRLRQLNDELETRVRLRTAALEQANQALNASLEDLKAAQDQLVEKEKMAALGALVSGVAHEINTPLGVCVTAASFLEIKVADLAQQLARLSALPADIQKPVHGIQEAAASISTNLNRAADLVKSFKQVAVDQAVEEKRRFNLKDYLQMVLMSLRPKLKRTAHEVVLDCPPEIELFSYPGVFYQILTNLVMNSLVHGFENIDHGRISIAVTAGSDTLVMHYADNGVGMTEQAVKQIFDPFFTTRRASGGSGLGMHIVYNIITSQLKGRITCKSAPGKGTQFEIHLPLEKPGRPA